MTPKRVFIIGSPRSGSSIFTLALRRATGLPGFHEGQVVDMFGKIENVIEQHYKIYKGPASNDRHALGNLPIDEMKNAMARALLELNDKLSGGTVWLDKTVSPGMLPFLRRLSHLDQPFATFFLYRRPIENVYSRLKKFPKHDIAYQTMDWVRIMQGWRGLRGDLPAGSWMEIEHRDMVDHPEQVAEGVARLVPMTAEQKATMVATFATARPQVLASESVGRMLTLEQTGWSDEQKTIFRDTCTAEMDAWGYTFDERYRVPPAA